MEYLDLLLGQQMSKIGRVSNMLWILFDTLIYERGYSGKILEKGEYSLHIQCPWRILDCRNDTIITASEDIYTPWPAEGNQEEFHWDISGSSLFDKKVESINSMPQIGAVKKISISSVNDLQVYFSNHWLLECFMDTTGDNEGWRYFRRGDKHFVVRGNGIAME